MATIRLVADKNGNEIPVGSTVLLRLTVTDVIAAAEPVNLLCRPEQGWPGLPDDQRWAIAASSVVVVPSQSAAAPEPPPAPAPVVAPAQPVQTWPQQTYQPGY